MFGRSARNFIELQSPVEAKNPHIHLDYFHNHNTRQFMGGLFRKFGHHRRHQNVSFEDEEPGLRARHVRIGSISDTKLHQITQDDGSPSQEASRHTSVVADGNRTAVEPLGPLRNIRVIDWSHPETAPEFLKLSDSVRNSLLEDGNLGPDAEMLGEMLDWALWDAAQKHPALTYETILAAHLDKLVADIVDHTKKWSYLVAFAEAFLKIAWSAETLQRVWRKRYKERYFGIDEVRMANLKDAHSIEAAVFPSILEAPEVGAWWLSIDMAHKAGFVDSVEEKVTTRGSYACILPLLAGREVNVHDNRTTYIREGLWQDMHIKLISQVGKEIRILRGSFLASSIAPMAGVRYDGLWKLSSYRQKRMGEGFRYRMELTLERVNDQIQMSEVLKVPKPSHLDDWRLWERVEADFIRQTQGEAAAYAWKLKREKTRHDREQWKRARRFRSSIGFSNNPFKQDAVTMKKLNAMNSILNVKKLEYDTEEGEKPAIETQVELTGGFSDAESGDADDEEEIKNEIRHERLQQDAPVLRAPSPLPPPPRSASVRPRLMRAPTANDGTEWLARQEARKGRSSPS